MKILRSLLFFLLVGTAFSSCSLSPTPTDTNSNENLNNNSIIESKMENENGTQVSIKVEAAKEMKLSPQSGDTVAFLKTSMGEIKVLLYTQEAPETTKNFIELSKQGKYVNVPFHRVIDDFMIQTGDFENKNGTGGYSYKGEGTIIEDEFSPVLKNVRGALSMANRGPNTGASQFFIVQKQDGASWLDGKHAVFGFVYEGMDIVDKIAGVDTDASDRPKTEILIQSIEITTL